MPTRLLAHCPRRHGCQYTYIYTLTSIIFRTYRKPSHNPIVSITWIYLYLFSSEKIVLTYTQWSTRRCGRTNNLVNKTIQELTEDLTGHCETYFLPLSTFISKGKRYSFYIRKLCFVSASYISFLHKGYPNEQYIGLGLWTTGASFEHGWVITSHMRQWIWLLIRNQVSS